MAEASSAKTELSSEDISPFTFEKFSDTLEDTDKGRILLRYEYVEKKEESGSNS